MEELSIGLMNNITEFSTEIKLLIEKLLSIKINALSSLIFLVIYIIYYYFYFSKY